MKLIETTTHEIARQKPRLAFWAVGTIEAHDLGPMGTDVIAPDKIAIDLAPRFDALLLPTLPFGLVSSLAGHLGGMWVSVSTYQKMIAELLHSIGQSGVSQVVVFNGHGGNSSTLARVLPDIWKSDRLKLACIDWWRVGEDLSTKHFGGAGGHGGADELALVRAARPDLGEAAIGWDGSRAFEAVPGVKTYPSPRSSIRYGSNEPIASTAESANAYYAELLERLFETVTRVLEGWAGMGR